MPRTKKLVTRRRVSLFILSNQLADMEIVRLVTGKTRTDCVKEALGLWLAQMHRQKVL